MANSRYYHKMPDVVFLARHGFEVRMYATQESALRAVTNNGDWKGDVEIMRYERRQQDGKIRSSRKT